MYFSFTAKKLGVFFLLVALLASGVYTTFAYKNERFGNMHIGLAVGKTMEKLAYLGIYGARSVVEEGNLLAATFEARFTNDGGPERARAVPVLIYHRLVGAPDGDNITRAAFADQMFALKRAGWSTITLREFEAFMRGEIELPERSVLITFDDGAKDSFYPVDPLFQVLGWSGVSFVLPKYSVGDGTSYYLSEGELRTMLESGRWEIGSHGQDSHEFLPLTGDGENGQTGAALANRLWLPEKGRAETPEEYRTRVQTDLGSSKASLEETFGVRVDSFAFPFGEYGQLAVNYPQAESVVRDVALSTYAYSFYQTWPGEGLTYNYPEDDVSPRLVKRIEVDPAWDGADLVARLERGLPKDIPFNDPFEDETGWFSIWGTYEIAGGQLRMQSAPQETGDAVILDGTGHWTDYTVIAKVDSSQRTGVFLYVRFKDRDNLAGCNFGNGFAHVEQIIAGEKRVIRGERGTTLRIPEGPFTVEARLDGRTLVCVLNGEELVRSAFLDPALERGGIGFKIWDPAPGKASLRIESVSVTGRNESGTALR